MKFFGRCYRRAVHAHAPWPWRRVFYAVCVTSLLHGCGGSRFGGPQFKVEPRPDLAVRDSMIPRQEPLCSKGNPASYEVFGQRYFPMKSSVGYRERGIASWYGPDFHGRNTSCGTVYNMYEMTAAHKLLPIPTYCEVTNLDNGRKIIVKVNDRGPFHGDRIIDLSYAAALRLGIMQSGTGRVEVRALLGGSPVPVNTNRTHTIGDAPAEPLAAAVGAPVNGAATAASTALPFGSRPLTPPPPVLQTHLSPESAQRLAAEVTVAAPEDNPLRAATRFDDDAPEAAKLALRATDRGVQILPAAVPPPRNETGASQRPAFAVRSVTADEQLNPEHDGTTALAVAEKQSSVMPTSLEDAGNAGRFVQVGAFTQWDNAVRLKSELNALVEGPVAIRTEKDARGTLYRVHIGPLASDAATGRVRATLSRLGLPNRVIMN